MIYSKSLQSKYANGFHQKIIPMILITNFFHKSFLFQWRYSCMRINSNSFSLHSFSGRYITGCRSPLINGSAIARLYSILIGHSESISLKIFSATPSPLEVPFIKISLYLIPFSHLVNNCYDNTNYPYCKNNCHNNLLMDIF